METAAPLGPAALGSSCLVRGSRGLRTPSVRVTRVPTEILVTGTWWCSFFPTGLLGLSLPGGLPRVCHALARPGTGCRASAPGRGREWGPRDRDRGAAPLDPLPGRLPLQVQLASLGALKSQPPSIAWRPRAGSAETGTAVGLRTPQR
ncbi:hypothetical protein NDU88_006186 [Pleurodeles waltl]|uniref:Uncharacterized protein n=1 Tax=Pleurodeles waltl TaxID=8319 RepID=A0AAV7TXL4_PLEWA|nr:hypothetical protein NDU88_006186 [Pleurodeles waltl]